MYSHTVTCEIGIFCVFSTFAASWRVDKTLLRRIFCLITRATVCVTLVLRPFPRLCSTVPVSLSFWRLFSTVRRGMFVILCISLADLAPLSQYCLIVCLWASSFALTIFTKV